jgi:capsular polysaccharide transport system permease protein
MNLPAVAMPASRPPRHRSPWEVQRAVLFAILLREMKTRVGGQWVGAVWTLIEPLTHVLIVVTIIGVVRGRAITGIEYPVYLVTGMLPYFLFQNLSLRLMDCVDTNKGLFTYRQVKPLDTMLSRACVEGLMNLIVYIFTLALLGRLGFSVIPADPLEMFGANAMLALLGTGLGIFYAVVVYDRPRLKSFLRMTSMPLYFASGVIFQVDRLPREYVDWLLFNPLLHLVELSRHAFIPAYTPVDGVNVTYPFVFALTVCAIGLMTYRLDRLRLVTT